MNEITVDEKHFNSEAIGVELWHAMQNREPIDPLVATYPKITIDQAYEVSKVFLSLRERKGQKVIGKKIGVTSKVVQEMLGVHQPDFGFLTDAMQVHTKSVNIAEMIAPRAEAEIAFKLKSDLVGPNVTDKDVIDATESVMGCFEIVDSRIKNWNIAIQDTIADNASCGVFVLSENEINPKNIDLGKIKVVVTKNGENLSQGLGSAVMGSPETAVAWLANTLGAYSIPLKKGEIILSGSLVPLEPVIAGDSMKAEFDLLGTCEVSFTNE